MTIKNSEISLKDLIMAAFALLIAILGYFMNQKLASIDSTTNQFYQFQREQIQRVENLSGQINLNNNKIDGLKQKDKEIENRIDRIEGKLK